MENFAVNLHNDECSNWRSGENWGQHFIRVERNFAPTERASTRPKAELKFLSLKFFDNGLWGEALHRNF